MLQALAPAAKSRSTAQTMSDFSAELLSFPAGRHDDQVDAIGLVGQLLDTMVRPTPPKPIVRPRRDWWDRPAVNWKTV
jgi:hypothetical protein